MTVRIGVVLNSLRVAALAVVAGLAIAPEAKAQSHPFGSHPQAYANGALKPAGRQGEIDRDTASFYAKWKNAYLKAGCGAGRYYVKADTSTAMVVSEGQGYGMLIVAMMAGEEPDARKIFDGLYRYYLDHPSGIDPHLMAWAQDKDCRNVAGATNATDGDLDAAYALLLAHKQWGSAGVDYLAGARRVMKALMRSNVNGRTSLTNLGDWVPGGGAKYRFATRSSDWMPGHFRAFAARGSKDWRDVLKASQRTAARLQATFASSTGLLPDFVVDTNGEAKPAPEDFLEGENDGRYGYNACRDPWRFGVDAAISGDGNSVRIARKMSAWARRKASGEPKRLRDGYELDGRATVQYQTMSFVAPFAVAAMVDPGARKWLDALWADMASRKLEGYYPDSIRMLSMLAVSRNWLTP